MSKSSVGAPTTSDLTWNTIDWFKVKATVRRLQMRIAKAVREKKHGRVKSLQWLLTHSYHAKLLAIKRVSQANGSKTAGIDGEIWKAPTQKMEAAKSLQRKGYQPLPLKRVYIPKNSGKRPLGIPTMYDRAMQALHLLALEPVVETQADKNAYGFRPMRSTADAIEQCFSVLAMKTSSTYILEGDIKSCFDKISHEWLLNNVQMDKVILNKWLTCGYREKQVFYRTEEGTPQGGVISPSLMNVTLTGLQQAVRKAVRIKDKVNVISYADDFVITGISKEILEHKVKPAVADFLKLRGLELSQQKTLITHIDDGFDFLGVNVRKYNGKFLTKPAKKAVKSFLKRIREIIKSSKAVSAVELIQILNPKIRGWTNHFRFTAAKKTFSYVGHCIFKSLWEWAKRRHPNKKVGWVKSKYFYSKNLNNWVFFAKMKDESGKDQILELINPGYVKIKRHIKIKAEATPFDPRYNDYFVRLKQSRKRHWGQASPMENRLPVF